MNLLLLPALLFAALMPAPRLAATPIQHVAIVMEENHNVSTVTPSSMPYLTGLGETYAHGSLAAIRHPSLPNYFAVTSGSTQGVTTDKTKITGADNIYHRTSWMQLSESMRSPCQLADSRPYVVHHAIAPMYSDLSATCKANDLPLVKTAVPSLASKQFTFITPNLNNDAHDGSLGAADEWLKVVIPQLMAQPTYADGSTLIEVTFDEGSSGNNHVYVAFINPALQGKVITGSYSHYSLLRLNEELLGVPLLGAAKTAPDLRAQLGL